MSRSKTEYLKAGGVDDREELKLQGENVKRAKNFKHLGSTLSSDGRCKEEMRRRIQAGWMCWKKVSMVLCDKKLSAKVKGKMYKSVVRPAIFYGIEAVAVTERQVGKIEVAELKMVRWALGVTRKCCDCCYPSHTVWGKVLVHSANSIAVSKALVLFFVLFAIFILHSRESKLYRYTLDGKSALAWELPFSRFMGHLSST